MAKPGCSGKMRHRITIQSETSADGAQVPTYATFLADVPCNVTDVAGAETFRGKQLEATTTHVIELRWYTGILPTMRIVYGSITIEIIKSLDRMGRGRYLEIQGTEVVI